MACVMIALSAAADQGEPADQPRRGVPLILVSIGNAIDETWAFIWLGAIVEVVLLATIVRLAWRWRAEEARGQVPLP